MDKNKKLIITLLSIAILTAIATTSLSKPRYETEPTQPNMTPSQYTNTLRSGGNLSSSDGQAPIIEMVTIYDDLSDKETQESYIKQFETNYNINIDDRYCYKGNFSGTCEKYKGEGNLTKELYPIVIFNNPLMSFIFFNSRPVSTPLTAEDIKYTLCNRYNFTMLNICK